MESGKLVRYSCREYRLPSSFGLAGLFIGRGVSTADRLLDLSSISDCMIDRRLLGPALEAGPSVEGDSNQWVERKHESKAHGAVVL